MFMLNALIGKKIEQSQAFLENGTRIPVTSVLTGNNYILQIKTIDKDGYKSAQLCFGNRIKAGKVLAGIVKKSGAQNAPLFIKEIKLLDGQEDVKPGDIFVPSQVFEAGDIVDVVGVSKGKGFAGGVKRYHFKGGPRTHGQSDRERAPGSIGQTTTPGRVYKGKRMAGRMGQNKVTIKNLRVINVLEDRILIKGLIPGSLNTIVVVNKVGRDKKFIPLFKEVKEDKKEIKEEKIADER